ncbi:class I SAM-dependent methyltransferase [Nocardioides aestuarii]|uniref:Methyltransferase n=1 Tax=Nocardioides aestuarii TaxID=252231 RepID=A0ABW4TL86_9ACTN
MSGRTEDTTWAVPLREGLLAAGYGYDAVAGLLGREAHDALARNETVPARRRTAGGSPLETLVRLFLLQVAVPRSAVEAALPGLVPDLAAGGVLVADDAEVRALVDCRPYADDDHDLWVMSDLTPGLDGRPTSVDADHVLGISPASTSLAQLTLRHDVDRALDLGTGCGVQALHLAAHSRTVVATDVNDRALWLARANAVLNGADNLDVRHGSLLEPVVGETFDLVATNPPFVISPPGGDRLTYRDSGLPGDTVVERIVRDAPDHLAPGGWLQVLANWAIHRDQPWDERLGGWLRDDCDALVVQREVLDPPSYVELWLKDSGRHGGADYVQRYDAWLAWFDEQRIEGVGFGWLNARLRPAGPGGTHRFLEWPHAVEQPVAPAIAAWGSAVGLPVDPDERLLRRPDVQQETVGAPGAEDPEAVVLRQQRGLMRARRADTVEAALVGACDGDLSVGQVLDALAHLLDRPADQVRATYLPVVAELVEEGFLTRG